MHNPLELMEQDKADIFAAQIKNININESIGKSKLTLLHTAVKNGKVEFVRMLCKAGADLTILDQLGIPPIMMAIENEHWPIVEILFKFLPKSQFSMIWSDNKTILSSMVNVLINLYLNQIIYSDKKNTNSLIQAKKILKYFIDFECICTGNQLYVDLFLAVVTNDLAKIDELSKTLDINYQYDSGMTLLHLALIFGCELTTIQSLLSNSSICLLKDHRNLTPADYAVIVGNASAYKLILAANPPEFFNRQNLSNIKPLSLASTSTLMLKLMLKPEFDLVTFLQQYQSVFDSIEFSQNLKDFLQALCEQELPINGDEIKIYLDEDEISIFFAENDMRTALITLLLKFENFDPNVKLVSENQYFNYGCQENSLSMLHIAAIQNNIDLLKLLFTHTRINFTTTGNCIISSEQDRQNDEIVTVDLCIIKDANAAHMAAIYGNQEVLELLLDKQPDSLDALFNYNLGYLGGCFNPPDFLNSLMDDMNVEIEYTDVRPDSCFWKFKEINLAHYFCIIGSWSQEIQDFLMHNDMLEHLLSKSDYYNLFPFDYAFYYQKEGFTKPFDFICENLTFSKLLPYEANQRLLKYIVTDNNAEATKVLLMFGAMLTKEIYDLAGDTVKELLDYRPGRKEKSLYERYQNNSKPLRIELERLLLDYNDSSDDSSSDDDDIECYEDEVLSLKGYPIMLGEETLNQLKVDHQMILDEYNKDQTKEKSSNVKYSSIRYIIHRGVHFDPKYFSKKERREKRDTYLSDPNHTAEHTCSFALLKLLKREEKESGEKISTQAAIEASEAYQTVDTFLATLKKTPNFDSSRKGKLETKYYRLIQDYVHYYANVINKKQIQSVFGFEHPWNPLISASFLLERAYVYASGVLFPQDHRLNPHYRRSTGKPKHPFLGVVYSYAIDLPYALPKAVNVLDLNHQGKIGIKGHYQHECEIIFENFIPDIYLIDINLLRLPSFEGTINDVPERWEYNPKGFTQHKNSILNEKNSIRSEDAFYGENSTLNKIIKYIKEGEAKFFGKQLHMKMYQQGIFPAYPFKDNELTLSPVKPPHKGKWSHQSSPVFFSPVDIKQIRPDNCNQLLTSPSTKKNNLSPDAILDDLESLSLENHSEDSSTYRSSYLNKNLSQLFAQAANTPESKSNIENKMHDISEENSLEEIEFAPEDNLQVSDESMESNEEMNNTNVIRHKK